MIFLKNNKDFERTTQKKKDMFKVLDFPLTTGSREGLEDVY